MDPKYKSQPFAEDFLLEDEDFVLEKRKTTENDDYEFLDETDEIQDEDLINRLPRRNSYRQKREAINANFHVVYKRKDDFLQHSSDYGKNLDDFKVAKNTLKRAKTQAKTTSSQFEEMSPL